MPRPKPKSRPSSVPGFRRARSDAQKQDRRLAILAAARGHLAEAGIDGFSMAALARQAGIAKGTLYLYFETREEVLLSLYTGQLEAFSAALTARVHGGMADTGFAAAFLDTARADTSFLDLSARLGSVIEHNVSTERLVESKRAMRDLLVPLALHLEGHLGLDHGRGAPMVAAMMALLLGASQMDAGPRLEGPAVPDDVVAMTRMFACDDLFLASAPALLAGFRRGPRAGG